MPTPAIALIGTALVAALAVAIWTDLRGRVIPNGLNAAIALAAPAWWWATGLALWPGVAGQLALAAAALLLFLGAFAIGAMGGGDVKLIAALGLWLLPIDFMRMLVWMSLLGGVLTLVVMALHRWQAKSGKVEIPYGVAIAAAAAPIIAERYLYHFGA